MENIKIESSNLTNWAYNTSYKTTSVTAGGINRIVVVCVSAWSPNASNPQSVSSLTVGGVGATRLAQSLHPYAAAEMWYRNNVPLGALTVACQLQSNTPSGGSLYAYMSAHALSNVDLDNPIGGAVTTPYTYSAKLGGMTFQASIKFSGTNTSVGTYEVEYVDTGYNTLCYGVNLPVKNPTVTNSEPTALYFTSCLVNPSFGLGSIASTPFMSI